MEREKKKIRIPHPTTQWRVQEFPKWWGKNFRAPIIIQFLEILNLKSLLELNN